MERLRRNEYLMTCPQLKIKYEELLTLQNKFQILNAAFQAMKSNTSDERELIATELKKQQDYIAEFINSNFAEILHISIESAKKIFDQGLEQGKTNVIGPVEIEKAFNLKLNKKEIPKISFSKHELQKAKEMGKYLILRVDKDDHDQPLTMKGLCDMMMRQGYDKQKNKTGTKKGNVTSKDHGDSETWWTNDPIPMRWALVDRKLIKGSVGEDYYQQTRILKKNVAELFKDKEMPDNYQDAIKEFDDYVKIKFGTRTDNGINAIIGGSDWKKYAQELSELKLNQLLRKTPAEELYDELAYYQTNDERLNRKKYNWTKRLYSSGYLVFIGDFNANGAFVIGSAPDKQHDNVGVYSSYSR